MFKFSFKLLKSIVFFPHSSKIDMEKLFFFEEASSPFKTVVNYKYVQIMNGKKCIQKYLTLFSY